jgi:hypothetical protein
VKRLCLYINGSELPFFSYLVLNTAHEREGNPQRLQVHVEIPCEKRISVFFECFLGVLSRACLGKMIILRIKWHRKRRHTHRRPGCPAIRPSPHSQSCRPRIANRKPHSDAPPWGQLSVRKRVVSFLSAFFIFVPSPSWSNDGIFSIKWHRKRYFMRFLTGSSQRYPSAWKVQVWAVVPRTISSC